MVDTSGTATEPHYCVKCGTRHGDYSRLNFCPHDGGFLVRSYREDRPFNELQCETCGRYFVSVGNDFVERA